MTNVVHLNKLVPHTSDHKAIANALSEIIGQCVSHQIKSLEQFELAIVAYSTELKPLLELKVNSDDWQAAAAEKFSVVICKLLVTLEVFQTSFMFQTALTLPWMPYAALPFLDNGVAFDEDDLEDFEDFDEEDEDEEMDLWGDDDMDDYWEFQDESEYPLNMFKSEGKGIGTFEVAKFIDAYREVYTEQQALYFSNRFISFLKETGLATTLIKDDAELLLVKVGDMPDTESGCFSEVFEWIYGTQTYAMSYFERLESKVDPE